MNNEFITLDSGLRIHYKEFGEKGPTLLLVHGWNNDWSGFIPLIKYLEKKFRVIAIDLPGYGRSEALSHDYTVEKLSDALSEFIDKKEKKVDVLCALSMGSIIAADFAMRHSSKTKSVVLIGPPIIKYDWKFSQIYRDLMTFINKSDFLMSIGHKFMASWWYGHLTAKYVNMHNYDKGLVNRYGMEGRKKIRPRVLFQMGRAMYYYHLERTLKEISIPMLIILGRYDKIVNLSEAVKIGKIRENIHTRWVEEAGHVVSLERPKEAAEHVFKFAETHKIL